MKLLALETSTEACSAALYVDGEVTGRYQLAPQQHNKLILPMIESLLAEAGLSLRQMDSLAFGRGPGSFTGVRIAAGVVQGLAFGADLPVAPVSTLAAMAMEAFAETDSHFAFPCIDARMGEVYWGVYRRGEDGLAELIGQEAVADAGAVDFPDEVEGFGIGSGWGTYETVLRERLEEGRVNSVEISRHSGMERRNPDCMDACNPRHPWSLGSGAPCRNNEPNLGSTALGGRVHGILADRFPRACWVARLGAEIFRRGECVTAEDAQPVYLRDKVAKKKGGGY